MILISNLIDKIKKFNTQINNSREINESIYGLTQNNFKNYDQNIDKTRFLSQEMDSRHKFNEISIAQKTKKEKEKKKREVTFSLTGNIKINNLMNPNKFYKDYYIKYVMKGLNENNSIEKKEFEK